MLPGVVCFGSLFWLGVPLGRSARPQLGPLVDLVRHVEQEVGPSFDVVHDALPDRFDVHAERLLPGLRPPRPRRRAPK